MPCCSVSIISVELKRPSGKVTVMVQASLSDAGCFFTFTLLKMSLADGNTIAGTRIWSGSSNGLSAYSWIFPLSCGIGGLISFRPVNKNRIFIDGRNLN